MHSTHDERPDDNESVDLTCDNARSLVPGYLDGELSEAQAAPLRTHLFACPACRETAKHGKNLKRWFSEAALPAVTVPAGFAARVARRAFAGDPGLLVPVEAADPDEEQANILPFLLQLTAIAAAVLLIFAVAIRTQSLPDGDQMRAEDLPPWERPLNPSAVFSDAHSPRNRVVEDPKGEDAEPAEADSEGGDR